MRIALVDRSSSLVLDDRKVCTFRVQDSPLSCQHCQQSSLDDVELHSMPVERLALIYPPGACDSTVGSLQDSSSISFHTLCILSFFSFAFSLFLAVLSSRSARKHLLTSRFAVLQPPVAFHKKPRAWHSSRAAITSSHPALGLVMYIEDIHRRQVNQTYPGYLLYVDGGASLNCKRSVARSCRLRGDHSLRRRTRKGKPSEGGSNSVPPRQGLHGLEIGLRGPPRT